MVPVACSTYENHSEVICTLVIETSYDFCLESKVQEVPLLNARYFSNPDL